jgi:hypothetical protein
MNVTASGTYYLFCKDVVGNVSTAVSQTYYSYEVHNMLNALEAEEGSAYKTGVGPSFRCTIT